MKKKSFFPVSLFFVCLLTLTNHALANPGYPPIKPLYREYILVEPSVEFQKIWAEHNIVENGRKGMRIHINLRIRDMEDKKCRVVAYFCQENGTPLIDRDGDYRTERGTVSTGENFIPPYDKSQGTLTMFMPYDELHVEGKYTLNYYLCVFYYEMQIGGSSERVAFNLTWRTHDSQENGKLNCGG